MKYLFLFYTAEGEGPEQGTSEWFELLQAYMKADEAMREAGVLIACEPLGPAAATTTVRVRNEETLLTDGPAAEIKEQVGGYALVECGDLDEAIKWASTIPAAHSHHVEIRPIMTIEAPS